MRVLFSRVAVVLAIIIALAAAPAAALRLTCRDGDPNLVVSPRGLGGTAFCNHDEPGDGICMFAVCGRLCPRCVGPLSPVCPEGPLPPSAIVVNVPVKKSRVRTVAGSRVHFRCLAPMPCDAAHNCTPMTLTCQDGVAADRTCDFDQTANGVCTFAFYCLESCGPVPLETVIVPVGETRVIQRSQLPYVGIAQLTLRCLPQS